MNRKAQAGVGTLIIFIALVLVAAVGASVLMQTTGKLQRQASVTGEHALREVSTKIDVRSVASYSSAPSTNKIDKLMLTVSPAAGGKDVQLEDVVLSYQSKDIYITGIRFNSTAQDNNDMADFYSMVIKGDADYILEQGEILELHFWIEDSSPRQLDVNTEFAITITPKSGTSTLVKSRTPSMLLYNYTTIG